MNLLHLGRPGIFVKSSRISNAVKKVLLHSCCQNSGQLKDRTPQFKTFSNQKRIFTLLRNLKGFQGES